VLTHICCARGDHFSYFGLEVNDTEKKVVRFVENLYPMTEILRISLLIRSISAVAGFSI